jgi:hypothetical protein
MCRQVKDSWLFTMTGRHKLYAELLTRYSSQNIQPQIIKKEISEMMKDKNYNDLLDLIYRIME